MRVLQVIPFFSPALGGSVTVLRDLATELARNGHEVTIVTSDFRFDKKFAAVVEESNVKVITFRTISNLGLFIYTPSINPWLRRNITNFDIIHMHNFRSFQNNSVCNYAVKNDIPCIIQAHGSVLPFFEKQGLKKIYDLVWGNKILNLASKVIAVSNMEKKQYLQMGIAENKIEVIPNGIDFSGYEILPKKGAFRKKYGISNGEKVILYLGRLHKRKGITFLIDGFSSIIRQNNNVKLVIVGPDEGFLDILIKQAKELKIEDRIIFTGIISEQEKTEAFVDSDLLVYPAIFEIFGLVPFEAIMCGTPVIVSDDCGCGEIIEQGQFGSTIHYGDVPDLSKKMNEILTDPACAKEKVRLGQTYIRDNFSWKRIVHDFERVYGECIYDEKKV